MRSFSAWPHVSLASFARHGELSHQRNGLPTLSNTLKPNDWGGLTMRKLSKWVLITFTLGAASLSVFSDSYAGRGRSSGESIVFYSARDGHPNDQIYVMEPDGDHPVRVTYDTASDVDPDTSPDGQEIVFTSNQTETGNNNIFIRDRWGTVRNLTNNSATDEWARWSPDGKQIVFDSNRDAGVFEVYVMNADGSNPRRLTDPPTLGRHPGWSPDGKKIIFRRGIDIYTINTDGSGGDPEPLTSEVAPSFAQMPAWSPDGRYIAFMSFREGYCSVFRMTADGSEQINLTPKEPGDPPTSWCSRAPAWSANGRRIFFMSSRPSTGGQNQIFVMKFDGTDVRQLTDTGTNGSPRARQRSNM
jgi:Tol biopolymer transport system component